MNNLQKTLTQNIFFSSISGFILILFSKQIANIFGSQNNMVFTAIGIVLIYFALTILYERNKQRKLAVIWIIIQDFIWVIGSVILLIFNPFKVSQTGNVIIVIIALIVLYLGIIQMVALNKKN